MIHLLFSPYLFWTLQGKKQCWNIFLKQVLLFKLHMSQSPCPSGKFWALFWILLAMGYCKLKKLVLWAGSEERSHVSTALRQQECFPSMWLPACCCLAPERTTLTASITPRDLDRLSDQTTGISGESNMFQRLSSKHSSLFAEISVQPRKIQCMEGRGVTFSCDKVSLQFLSWDKKCYQDPQTHANTCFL